MSVTLAAFSGKGTGRPLYLPDLTLWYQWHHARGTLPAEWQGKSLPQAAQALGVPTWQVARPWVAETPGVETCATEQAGERSVCYQTPAGTLSARWTIGPDGDWWQAEHLVKTVDDLPAALSLVQARSYVLDTEGLASLQAATGSDGVLAVQIPRRPYSDLLHDFLGWGEGLYLLGEPAIAEILAALEAKLQAFLLQLSQLPTQLFFSPDNLDGQFISPRAFQTHLADSYAQTTQQLHAHGKNLVVHIGGPIRHLLASLAEAGVDAVEGVAGPPQSDASLPEARAIAGPELILWGGIPQDWLLSTCDEGAFEESVARVAVESSGQRGVILGVADKVPADAELDRLVAIPSLIEQAHRRT
jgi:hypothetical protein